MEKVNASGIATDSFTIMSGFRTPFYNAAIDNVEYSRHVYGDAADVFIDRDGNGSMDDLNGDGICNVEDAKVLRDLVEGMGTLAKFRRLVGGLASYRRTESHGPFVHIDARGHRARWGS